MAYKEDLAQRVRDLLSEQSGYVEKKMFGGIGFLLHGNMACGVLEDQLIIRVGPERYEQARLAPWTQPLDRSGRPMTGWVTVFSEGYQDDQDLARWVDQGVEFALTLPPK